MILTGAEAVDKMVDEWPDAHKAFGFHRSAEHFALAIEQPRFTVLEDSACWVILEDVGDGVLELHWFCPLGADIKAVRRMIQTAFDQTGVDRILGFTPPTHPRHREAGTLARALGAIRGDGCYTLTRKAFQRHNNGKF